MVVEHKKHHERQTINSEPNMGNSYDRCIKNRLGRPFEQQNNSGDLVKQIQEQPHKQSGVGSSVSNNQTFLSSSNAQTSTDSIRQHNSCTIHQQTRGDKVNEVMSTDLEIVELCGKQPNDIESSSHSRGSEHSCGQVEQNTSQTNRMVVEHSSGSNNFQSLGFTDDRLICNQPESQSSSVLFLETRPQSICTGCPVNIVGESQGLCVSTPVSNPKSVITHAELPMRGNTDSTFLAKTTMVPPSTSSSDSISSKINIRKKSVNTKSGKSKSGTSKSRNLQPDCMEIINNQLKTKGFSKKARKLLSASWRSGTQKDYKAKFRKFNSWCDQWKIDPYQASLEDCANFLTSLFEKGLQYRTIAGYRSMLSSVLPTIDKISIGQHPYIIRLLKGVFNSRPPERRLLPEWDLPLVLEMFKKKTFSPLKCVRLRYVTWKTVFLVAITIFRRCSDLQSLRIGEGSVNIQEKGITFIRHGLTKQDRVGHDNSKIFVPSFPENKLLDPKRAIYEYLKRTEEFRNKDDKKEFKLFLSINKPHKPVTSQTLSSWIVNTIKMAYKLQNKSIKNVRGHSTRSIGPSWALFKGANIKNILDSADWSRANTFIKFYLKDVNINFLNL